MPKYTSHKQLAKLTLQKFVDMWNRIMGGEILYRTHDYRLLDFKKGTEKQLYRGRK